MAIYYNTTPATAVTLISLTEAKEHLRVDHNYEDNLITALIAAAISIAENYTATNINPAIVTVKTNRFNNYMRFRTAPVTAINYVKYYNISNELTVLDTLKYNLVNFDKFEKEIIYTDENNLPAVASRFDAVQIELTTGYAELPNAMRSAILLLIGYLYENRDDKPDGLPRASATLLAPYRYYH